MCNKDIKEKFSIEIKKRFEALQSDNNTDNDPNTMYNNIFEANQYAASETIPIITKRPSTAPWHSQSIEVKGNAVSQVIKVSLENPSPENSEQIRKASEELDHQYKKEQEKYVKNKIAELNNAHTNKKSKVVWQIANEISNRKKSKRSILKGKSKQDRLSQWKNHFTNLLGQAPPIINIPTKRMIDLELHIEKNDSTMKELQIVIKILKNNKASGIDNIPAEVWKAGICNEQLLCICNRVYNQQPVDIWRQSCIILLPKKVTCALLPTTDELV